MAAKAVIACPHCHKKFKGAPELKGRKIKCPKCARPFVVDLVAVDEPVTEVAPVEEPATEVAPVEEAVTVPPPAAKATNKSKDLTWDDEDEDGNPYGAVDIDLAPRCPHCANEMESEDAVVCTVCGYNTQTRQLGRTEKTIATTAGDHFRWLLPGIACAITDVLIVVGYLYFCFQIPFVTRGSWTNFLDHESMRLWLCLMLLGMIWGIGLFVFKRLFLEPMPPEKVKD